MIGQLSFLKQKVYFNDKQLYFKKVVGRDEDIQFFLDETKTEMVGVGWIRECLFGKEYIKISLHIKGGHQFLIAKESTKKKGLFFLEFDNKTKKEVKNGNKISTSTRIWRN